MKETYTKETGPGQPRPGKDVIVTDRRPERPEPDSNKTPLWVAIGILATVVVAGIFWAMNKDDRLDERVTTNVVTEPIAVREVNPENQDVDRETFISTSTVEIRDLRSNVDTMAQNASAENRDRIIAYQSRVDTLDRALRESDNSAEVRADLESQLQAMRTEYTQLQNDLQIQTTATRAEADQALDTAEDAQEQATQAGAQATEAGEQTDLTAFAEQAETRIESLETQLAKLQAGPQTEQTSTNFTRLETEVENVSTKVDEMQASGDMATRGKLRENIDISLSSLERQMDGLEL
jgi:hypothetical protein